MKILEKILYIPVILFTILISPVMLCFGVYMLIMFNRSWKRALKDIEITDEEIINQLESK